MGPIGNIGGSNNQNVRPHYYSTSTLYDFLYLYLKGKQN